MSVHLPHSATLVELQAAAYEVIESATMMIADSGQKISSLCLSGLMPTLSLVLPWSLSFLLTWVVLVVVGGVTS